MAPLLVLVAHNGKTILLEVQNATRVSAVLETLVSFTKIKVQDQIVIYNGVTLDASKTLGDYHLPQGRSQAEENPIFLYCKAHLKTGNPMPPPEFFPPLQVALPPLMPAPTSLVHPLSHAPSPRLRALPDLERLVQHHLESAQAFWDVAKRRVGRCRQLLSEQEVQARSVDAARVNAELHLRRSLESHAAFEARFARHRTAHVALLDGLTTALQVLQDTVLPPPLQSDRRRVLSDLVSTARLRTWADACRRSLDSFVVKVADLATLWSALKADAGLFLAQPPSVDLDALGRELAQREAAMDEQSAIMDSVSKDLRRIQTLVETVVRELAAGRSISSLEDNAAAMETVHESIRTKVLPRLTELDSSSTHLCTACEASKISMTRDVITQLQSISSIQSRVRDLRSRLAAYHEVLLKQASAFQELRVVQRLAVAYRCFLAELVRRKGWIDRFRGLGAQLAEHMAALREQEETRRNAFSNRIAKLLPPDLLSAAGVSEAPPLCSVDISIQSTALMEVDDSDLPRIESLEALLDGVSDLHRQVHGGVVKKKAKGAIREGGPLKIGEGCADEDKKIPVQRSSKGNNAWDADEASEEEEGEDKGLPKSDGSMTKDRSDDDNDNTELSFENAQRALHNLRGVSVDFQNACLRSELGNQIVSGCLRELQDLGVTTPHSPRPSLSSGMGNVKHGESATSSMASSSSLIVDIMDNKSRSETNAQNSNTNAFSTNESNDGPAAKKVIQDLTRALLLKESCIKTLTIELNASVKRATTLESRVQDLERLLNRATTKNVPRPQAIDDANSFQETGILEQSLDASIDELKDCTKDDVTKIKDAEDEDINSVAKSVKNESSYNKIEKSHTMDKLSKQCVESVLIEESLINNDSVQAGNAPLEEGHQGVSAITNSNGCKSSTQLRNESKRLNTISKFASSELSTPRSPPQSVPVNSDDSMHHVENSEHSHNINMSSSLCSGPIASAAKAASASVSSNGISLSRSRSNSHNSGGHDSGNGGISLALKSSGSGGGGMDDQNKDSNFQLQKGAKKEDDAILEGTLRQRTSTIDDDEEREEDDDDNMIRIITSGGGGGIDHDFSGGPRQCNKPIGSRDSDGFRNKVEMPYFKSKQNSKISKIEDGNDDLFRIGQKSYRAKSIVSDNGMSTSAAKESNGLSNSNRNSNASSNASPYLNSSSAARTALLGRAPLPTEDADLILDPDSSNPNSREGSRRGGGSVAGSADAEGMVSRENSGTAAGDDIMPHNPLDYDDGGQQSSPSPSYFASSSLSLQYHFSQRQRHLSYYNNPSAMAAARHRNQTPPQIYNAPHSLIMGSPPPFASSLPHGMSTPLACSVTNSLAPLFMARQPPGRTDVSSSDEISGGIEGGTDGGGGGGSGALLFSSSLFPLKETRNGRRY
mmetsp:Transcript_29538/g.54221  ORF Transcript_29538/g.54221 Transcript_29538/m.54221 type:complete len:1398 (-) Transcript_29538:16-4209(-)